MVSQAGVPLCKNGKSDEHDCRLLPTGMVWIAECGQFLKEKILTLCHGLGFPLNRCGQLTPFATPLQQLPHRFSLRKEWAQGNVADDCFLLESVQ